VLASCWTLSEHPSCSHILHTCQPSTQEISCWLFVCLLLELLRKSSMILECMRNQVSSPSCCQGTQQSSQFSLSPEPMILSSHFLVWSLVLENLHQENSGI
jgi:hypothetical protein